MAPPIIAVAEQLEESFAELGRGEVVQDGVDGGVGEQQHSRRVQNAVGMETTAYKRTVTGKEIIIL